MIKKIYIDNYKCLVDFELELSNLSLFIGLNGTGKSTVFEALYRLRRMITDGERVGLHFDKDSRTRRRNDPCQTFKLGMDGNGGHYEYELVIKHFDEKPMVRITKEYLFYNSQPLYKYDGELGLLYYDNDSLCNDMLVDATQSGLSSILERPYNTNLIWFKNRIFNIVVLGFNPMGMSALSKSEEIAPSINFENFSSWHRFVSQQYAGNATGLIDELKKALPGFKEIRNYGIPGSREKTLQVSFQYVGDKTPVWYDFDEISDGQRMMIALYSLLFILKNNEYSLFLEEPDNFLALQEIQPWLDALYDKCDSGEIVQASIISHHPELINLIGISKGIMFDREPDGSIRTKCAADFKNESGLQLSEVIARGWDV